MVACRAAQDTIGIAVDPAAHAHTQAVREMSLLALTMARKILQASTRRRSPSPRRQTSVCRAGTRAHVNAMHCARGLDLEPSAGITQWRRGAVHGSEWRPETSFAARSTLLSSILTELSSPSYMAPACPTQSAASSAIEATLCITLGIVLMHSAEQNRWNFFRDLSPGQNVFHRIQAVAPSRGDLY